MDILSLTNPIKFIVPYNCREIWYYYANFSWSVLEYIDVKLTSNISSGSLSIVSGSYLPKLTLIDTNTIGQSTQQTYRLYSGTDDEDVLTKGTNAASWSYNTPSSNTHTGTYIFTKNGFSSSVQIEGVLKGDKSKNLNATSNANQFFYKISYFTCKAISSFIFLSYFFVNFMYLPML